jgi:guanylate cyclase
VGLLDRIFSAFDTLADLEGLEKIKTIGDAYMVVGGAPEQRIDHAQAIARLALAMRRALAPIAVGVAGGLQIRIGIDTGPAVAGVIGTRKFIYDLWGDTVNTASRMESHGVPGEIQLTARAAAELDGAFELARRGPIEVKGKGLVETFFLLGER